MPPSARDIAWQRAPVAALRAARVRGQSPWSWEILGILRTRKSVLHPKKRRLRAATAQSHARRHRVLCPPYRLPPPFVPASAHRRPADDRHPARWCGVPVALGVAADQHACEALASAEARELAAHLPAEGGEQRRVALRWQRADERLLQSDWQSASTLPK